MLCAWAGPTLFSALQKKPQPYAMSVGVGVLVAATITILAFMLLAIPLVFGWRLARWAAIGILLIYGLSQIVFLLVEEFL